MVFLLTLFYPLSFCDEKGGVIFYLDQDCIFNRSSDFCPRMAKRGSLLVFVLAAFCWTKSLLCNVAAFTRMLFYSESTLQL
jgi:hypothetical protein